MSLEAVPKRCNGIYMRDTVSSNNQNAYAAEIDDVGPIIRIASNEVAIADPEAIRTIYSAHSGFTKVSALSSLFPKRKNTKSSRPTSISLFELLGANTQMLSQT